MMGAGTPGQPSRNMNVTLGKDSLTTEPFVIDTAKHTIVQGGSGVGKSTLIANICIQIIWQGGGLCLIDPHGDVADTIKRFIPKDRMRDFIWWDPSASHVPPFNPLYFKRSEDLELVKEALHSLLKYLAGSSWGPETDRIIVNALNAITEHFSIATCVHLFRFLADDEFRKTVLSKTTDPTLKMFAEQYDVKLRTSDQMSKFSPSINKTGKLLHPAIVSSLGQLESLEPLEIMNNRRILICRFSKGRLGEEVAQILGSLVIAMFAIAALQREHQKTRHEFAMIVDEMPTFIAAGGAKTILAEGRKYGLSLISGFQGSYQIPFIMDFLANAPNQLVFNSSGQDAELMAKNWGSDTRAKEIVELKRYTFIGRTFEKDNPKIRTVTGAKPIKPKGHKADPTKLIKHSLERWSKDRREVEQKVLKFLGSEIQKPKLKRSPQRKKRQK